MMFKGRTLAVGFLLLAAPGRVSAQLVDKRGLALDGMKLDQQGHPVGLGSGGLWVLSSAGKHLGTIRR